MKKKNIPMDELRKLVELNRSNESIARRYGVSQRTVTRRVKVYLLKGIRPKGRKPKKKTEPAFL